MNRAILLGLGFLAGLVMFVMPLVPGAQDADQVAPPKQALQQLVEPIRGVLAGDDAAAIGEFCLVFADVLRSDADSQLISDTAELHDRLVESSVLMFQHTGIEDRHPDLADRIDRIIAEWMGVAADDGQVENVELDASTRAKAIEAFEAIAWAAGGG